MARTTEEAQKLLQEMAAEITKIMAVMSDVAQENHIETFEIPSGVIRFMMDDGQIPLTGPIIHAADDYSWRSSRQGCYPEERVNRWLYGDDESLWDRSPYDEEGY